MDEKIDKVTKELQTNNMRLKGLVTKVGGGPVMGGCRASSTACSPAGWSGVVASRHACLAPPGPAARPQMRSTRNFVVDIVLICILLAIGLYLYK